MRERCDNCLYWQQKELAGYTDMGKCGKLSTVHPAVSTDIIERVVGDTAVIVSDDYEAELVTVGAFVCKLFEPK